ncbi:MAG: TfoX/Sxy family transcriptional regulator of competence genes [Granulosicoccus sp.]|jgi:TfoX/Sxy family transcriptional regulator of competence genes
MAYNEDTHQYASEQLSAFKEFTCKKMFGSKIGFGRQKRA